MSSTFSLVSTFIRGESTILKLDNRETVISCRTSAKLPGQNETFEYELELALSSSLYKSQETSQWQVQMSMTLEQLVPTPLSEKSSQDLDHRGGVHEFSINKHQINKEQTFVHSALSFYIPAASSSTEEFCHTLATH